MEVEFADEDLDPLETELQFTAGFGKEIVRGFRKVMQAIRAATDERDLYLLKGLHFKKLEGSRSHQRSIRINDQWRLVLEITGTVPNKKIRIVCIEDYH